MTNGCKTSTLLGALDGEHGPQPAEVGEDHLAAGGLGALAGQVGVDPIDDLPPVAGVDHDDIERLAVGIVVVAHQHVVEDPALVVGHEGIADLAQFHVGHAASEQFGQEHGRTRPFEPQPAHVGNIRDGHGVAGDRMFLDDRRILDRHGPAREVDHPAPCATCQSKSGVFSRVWSIMGVSEGSGTFVLMLLAVATDTKGKASARSLRIWVEITF